MVDVSLVVAIASAALAGAALLFASVQAAAAFSQYFSSVNRCDRNVTGAFDLRQGFWLNKLSLTPNTRYRMPVFTMPALRKRSPVMEQGRSFSHDLTPGNNFRAELNGYLDGNRARLSAKGNSRTEMVARVQTLRALAPRLCVAPFALAHSLTGLAVCIPCDVWYVGGKLMGVQRVEEDDDECGGCGAKTCAQLSLAPMALLFQHSIKRKIPANAKVAQQSLPESETPALEPALWVQFLMNYQVAWWGYANLRW